MRNDKTKKPLFQLDLDSIIKASKRMKREWLEALTSRQKSDIHHTCEQAIAEIKRVMKDLK